MLFSSKKHGGISHLTNLLWAFYQAIFNARLTSLLLKGYLFTWEQFRYITWWVKEKLDHSIMNQEWTDLFLIAKLTLISISTLHLLSIV